MKAAEFVGSREGPLEKLITHRYTLDQAEEAQTLSDTGRTGKSVFMLE